MNILISEGGADVNIQDAEGITALHWACSVGSLEAVQLLMHMGASFNVMEVDGERLTPLDYAIIGNHQEVTQLLIEQGALSISSIRELAATMIQRCVRGFLARKEFGPQLAEHRTNLRAAQAKKDTPISSAGVRDERRVSSRVGRGGGGGGRREEEVDGDRRAGERVESREVSGRGRAEREDKTAERMR